jgi:iron complex outermembrane recepter protein
MIRTHTRRLLVPAAMAPFLAANAQETTAEAPIIEAVVVTAQRREENLQDVPIAVTALSATQLETRGISSVESLNAIAPNLQVGYTPGNTRSV